MQLNGFIGPSYVSRSLNADAQRCVNLYPEIVESTTGKNVAALYGTPGLELFGTLPISPVRGFWLTSAGRFFVVGGNKLYEVDFQASITERGTLTSSSGPVSMADNGLQLCVVTGPDGFILTLATNAFAQISSPGWKGADKVAYQDGYFIFNQPNTSNFYISALYDGSTIDPLDFAVAEGDPDNIVSVVSDHRELWVFGKKTIEVFFNSGNANFPFERVQGAFIEYGCAAPHSVAKLDNSLFWLGFDNRGAGTVYRNNGYSPMRVSTHAVEHAVQQYGDISDAVAYSYQEEGHSFYVVNFTNANATWVYDTATGLWHERASTDPISGILSRHRGNYHVFAFNKHLIGDFENGKIYTQDLDLYDEEGTRITRMRTSPHVHQDLKFVFYNSMQVDLEAGVGVGITEQSADPQIMMQFSDDGGHTWSNERWVAMGKVGQYKRRALWRRLGKARDRVFRVVITDPIKVALINASIDAYQGAS